MTNRNAAAVHRRLDDAQAEALARDGGEVAGRQRAVFPPRQRRQDMRTMNRPREPRVLLLQLAERTSGRTGKRYLSGWCGKARLVGFLSDGTDRHGNPVWNVYAAEPGPRESRQVGRPPGSASGDGGPAKGSARPQERGEEWRG